MATAWKIGMSFALTGLACSSQQLPDFGAGGSRATSAGGNGGRVPVLSDAGIGAGYDAATDRGSLPRADAQAAVDAGGNSCTYFEAPPLVADFNHANGQVFGDGAGSPSGKVVAGSLSQDFSGLSWHMTGVVHTGGLRFGLLWSCSGVSAPVVCDLDVSRYVGLQFTIKGDAGPDQAIDLVLGQPDDDPVTIGGCGTCPSSASCNKPRISIDLSAARDTPQTITVLWPNVAGGAPTSAFQGKALSSVVWYLRPAPAGENVPVDADPSTADGFYPVDLTIDDIQFVPIGTPEK